MIALKELATKVATHHGLEVESVARVLMQMEITPAGCDELAAHPGRLQPFTCPEAKGEIAGATGWVLFVGNRLQSLATRCLTDESHALSDECLEAQQKALSAE